MNDLELPVVSAWYDDQEVYLTIRRGDKKTIKKFPAKWSIYVETSKISAKEVLSAIPKKYPVTTSPVNSNHIRLDIGGTKWLGPRQCRYRVREILAKKFGQNVVREADVDPIRRLFVDNKYLSISSELRLLFIDIEAQSPGRGIEDARNGLSRILSYSCQGSDGREKSEVLLEHDPRDGWSIPEDELDRHESDFLIGMLKFIKDYDVIIAWYGGGAPGGSNHRQGFDFDCIRERCKYLGIHVTDSWEKKPPYDITWNFWAWLDHMEVYGMALKNAGSGDEKESLNLDHVSKSQGLSQGKIEFDASKVYEVWASGPEGRKELKRYNIQDTALMPQIEAKTGYLAQFLSVCQLCSLIPNTKSLKATQQADGYLLSFGGRQGYYWATAWGDDKEQDNVPGAYVFPANPGVYENICVVDFEALYPSIMKTLNIGPDTVIHSTPDGKPDCPPGIPLIKSPTINVWFKSDKISFFRLALETMIGQRKIYQKERDKYSPGSDEYKRYQNLDAGAKVVANSFYGVLLCKYWRYYDRDAGEAVTSTGKWLIQHVATDMQEFGKHIVKLIGGGDTDSLFVGLIGDPVTPRGSQELFTDIGKELKEVVNKINQEWPKRFAEFGCKETFIYLDWEEAFTRFIILKKKMYFGCAHMTKGSRPKNPFKHKIRGLAMRRGDKIKFARNMQKELVEMVIGDENQEKLPDLPTLSHLQTWALDWKTKIVDAELTLPMVKITQSISKTIPDYYRGAFTSPKCRKCKYDFGDQDRDGLDTCPECDTIRNRATPPMHVRVAEQMMKNGLQPLIGDRIPYVIIYDQDLKKEKPVHFDSVKSINEIDRGYYWKATYSPAYSVLTVIQPDYEWPHPEKEMNAIRKASRISHHTKIASEQGLFGLISESSQQQDPVVVKCSKNDVDKIVSIAEKSNGNHPLHVEIENIVNGRKIYHRLETQHNYKVNPDMLLIDSRFEEVDKNEYRYKG
jgi:DNA polymerase elongation subunit (family B)